MILGISWCNIGSRPLISEEVHTTHSKELSFLYSKPQVDHMIRFVCNYIKNDAIGLLSNAHLAWADIEKEGIFSSKCCQIAEKLPLCLDFAKTGQTAFLRRSEKPRITQTRLLNECGLHHQPWAYLCIQKLSRHRQTVWFPHAMLSRDTRRKLPGHWHHPLMDKSEGKRRKNTAIHCIHWQIAQASTVSALTRVRLRQGKRDWISSLQYSCLRLSRKSEPSRPRKGKPRLTRCMYGRKLIVAWSLTGEALPMEWEWSSWQYTSTN